MSAPVGLAGRLAQTFIDSKLTQLIVLTSLLLGLFAVLVTPREEEPQIVVPFADVLVEMPGAGIKEVEERISIPLEKKLREIPGVEYVYSTSQPGAALAIVRFHVGEDEERSMVKLHDKLRANFDLIPPGASQPLVKPRSIDDVPILALTLWSERADPYMLRRIAAELDDQIKAVPDVSETRLIGGLRRHLRVTLDRDRLAGFSVTPGEVVQALGEANREQRVGRFARDNREYLVNAGIFLTDPAALRQVVVGVLRGRPVHLGDVASVDDGPEEPRDYVLLARGAGAPERDLAVNEHEVVSTREPTEGWPPTNSTVRTSSIVVLEPAGHHPPAIRGGVEGPVVRPFAEGGLNEPLGLAVRPRRVRPRPPVDHLQAAARGAETSGEVARPVVSEHASDAHAAGAKPAQGPAQEGAHCGPAFVVQQLHVGHPRVIIDRDVQKLPADPARAILSLPGNAMADPANPAQLLRVQVQQVARRRVLIATAHRRRLEAESAREADAPQGPRDRRRAHPDRPRDLRARPPLVAQHLGPELDLWLRGPGARMRPARPILQPGAILHNGSAVLPHHPLARGLPGHAERLGRDGERRAPRDQGHQFLSTIRRESGILVHVHPGLLSRVSNDLAATTFPRSAWVNNLLLRHS